MTSLAFPNWPSARLEILLNKCLSQVSISSPLTHAVDSKLKKGSHASDFKVGLVKTIEVDERVENITFVSYFQILLKNLISPPSSCVN